MAESLCLEFLTGLETRATGASIIVSGSQLPVNFLTTINIPLIQKRLMKGSFVIVEHRDL